MAKFNYGNFLGFTAVDLLLSDEILNIKAIIGSIHSRHVLDALSDLNIEFEILKGRLLELKSCDTIDYSQASLSVSAYDELGIDEEDENKFILKHKKALIKLYNNYTKFKKQELTLEEFNDFLDKGSYGLNLTKCESIISIVNKFRKLSNTITFGFDSFEVSDNCVSLVGIMLRRMDILDSYLLTISELLKSTHYENAKFMGETLYNLSRKKNTNLIFSDIILPYTTKVSSNTISNKSIMDTCNIKINSCEGVFRTGMKNVKNSEEENNIKNDTLSTEQLVLINSYPKLKSIIERGVKLSKLIIDYLESFNEEHLCKLLSSDKIDTAIILSDFDNIGLGGLTLNGIRFLEYSIKTLSFVTDTRVTVIDDNTNPNLNLAFKLMYQDAQSKKMFLDKED